MFHLLHTINLLEGINRKSFNPICWSKYDDLVSVVVKNGVYILEIKAVPSNMMPNLNTFPNFIPSEDPNDPICETEWLPNKVLLTLNSSSKLFSVQSSNRKWQSVYTKELYTFSWYEGHLYLFDFKNTLLVGKLDTEHEFARIASTKLDDACGEILPQKFGTNTLIFASLRNGTVKVCKFDGHSTSILADSCWQDEDFMAAKSMRVINILEDNSCKLLFSKGVYVVISQLDLSVSVKVQSQQCVEIGQPNIVNLEMLNNEQALVTSQGGQNCLITVPEDISQPCGNEELPEVDAEKHLLIRGIQASRNRLLWIMVRDGPKQEPRGKLSILTLFDLKGLFELSEFWNVDHGLHDMVDFLELARIFILLNTLGPSTVSQIVEEKLNSGKTSPHIKFWMGSFMARFCQNDENLYQKWTGFASKVAEKSLKSVPKSTVKWKCPTCGKEMCKDKQYLDVAVCKNGHNWPKCSKSQKIIDTDNFAQCHWCGSLALEDYSDAKCSLCSGSLETVIK